ncbi:glycerol kinase GlpK [Gloeobacter violaceus]|uniref:Glycerol kinase n=1 Tax=Gloeobacter violaceus (strain ATCC 29082 / PCC 7421) TaxID=251221 RepID=GLPK_GLOVI|nr:glycerol kinase GlpK [Gloeobacter violaceus]Q7NJT1.1 RecName: Full=Glycerol kinase; AltName: Full=ATP:glycerol 3-phosphotransferase; AltName: Full=Glycerokinase; Short=GK [Gloeobacter violaceus PCC 7421]BAC89692.1 glycerol kinase [Gloeobacter violaceus PCC 7421]
MVFASAGAAVSGAILALDLGTTGIRALLFDPSGAVAAGAYREVPQIYPQPGWVEHDPQTIWQLTCEVVAEVQAQSAARIAAVGLTNQRETCLLWDAATGTPHGNAIVWQDRRTAALCQKLRAEGWEAPIRQRTGLVIDAYFSATKLAWLLAHRRPYYPGLKAGTIDSWIIWKLTGGRVHATDTSNASRTMLFNLHTRDWDPELLELLAIPAEILPAIKPSLGVLAETDVRVLGYSAPIAGILGDQQAALFAHGCDRPGLVKCTYGTGSFLVAHTGDRPIRSRHQLLTTVAWSDRTSTGYALEGALFTTGASVQWLRDGLGIIETADESEALAASVPDSGGVYFVPALSGLGAPHWDMGARGLLIGLTRGSGRGQIARAVLEAIAFQTREVTDALAADMGTPLTRLKVDGGAVRNNLLMQLQADVLGVPVERPQLIDTTAQGAAFAAGLGTGFWGDYAELVAARPIDRVFESGERQLVLQAHYAVWQRAVERSREWVR